MTGAWSPYAQLAIDAGAERCAIYGHDGIKRGGAGPNDGVTSIQELKKLIADVKGGVNNPEAMTVDGTRFINTHFSDGILLGKAGDYVCAVCPTSKTIIIVITKGGPHGAQIQLDPVRKALAAKNF